MTEPKPSPASEIAPEQQTELLWEYLRGFHAVHLINIGVELGLFERIAKAGSGITAGDLAEVLKLHPPYVGTWCRTAYAYRLLDADGAARFRLAPHFDTILVDQRHPRFLAPYVQGATSFFADDFKRYPALFKTGATYSFQDHGHEFSAGIAAMTAGFHAVIARKMLPALPGLKHKLAAGARVLDMGCGAGGLLIKIAEAHAQAVCVGIDVDAHGVGLARARIAEAGLSERITVELSDGGAIAHQNAFDVVILFEVLHEIPPTARARVLANCFQALKPGAPLFVLDETYPATLDDLRKPEFGLAVQTAFNELIWGNVVPTAADQDQLLGEAGFREVERQQVASYFTALTAWKS